MAYSELIKSFQRIRDYMRQFYIYGFKSREEYTAKSARSYDNERRRIESWLGDYMSFRQDSGGKSVFLSVDSRHIPHNPLYKAFKAKSFTDKDITLHFYILDILADGEQLSSRQIADAISDEYLSRFGDSFLPDESTVRKKLKEYEELGLLCTEKRGREVLYRRTDDSRLKLESWSDALAFFSEEDPLGVVGYFLQEKTDTHSDAFRFKHHYILHALDSDILCDLLQAIRQQCCVEIKAHSLRGTRLYTRTICPLKIYISSQTGRQYLLGYHYRGGQMTFYRIDSIDQVEIRDVEMQYQAYLEIWKKFDSRLWGVSTGTERGLEHITMLVRFGENEEFIPQRLEREKRHGTVVRIAENLCLFTADVYDASEMLPWLRTFIGRIVELKCSNPYVMKTFSADLQRMREMYGGEHNAVQ